MSASTFPQKTGIPGYPQSAWASLPSASLNNGVTYQLTDSWAPGLTATSNGTVWKLSGKARFAAGAPNDTVTGTTSRTALREVTIPGGLMGTYGTLTSNAFITTNNNANAKNPQVYIYQTAGGLAGGTLMATTGIANQNALGHQVLIRNTATNAQLAMTANVIGSLGTTSVAAATAAVDTTQDWIFAYACTPANSGDSVVLAHYNIEIDQRF